MSKNQPGGQVDSSLNSSHLHHNDELFVDLQIRVIDSGVGISEEGLSKLFIDFSRLKENQERNKSGTGLGLSICK